MQLFHANLALQAPSDGENTTNAKVKIGCMKSHCYHYWHAYRHMHIPTNNNVIH